VSNEYNETQLDALRELANIGAGNAATALSQMLGQEVELNVPRALALPLADAVDAAGPAEQEATGVVIPVEGALEGVVLLLIPCEDAEILCSLLGVEAGTDVGESALCEIGNILGTSYLNSLAAMTGLELLPCPPHIATDLLAAIVASVLAETAGDAEKAIFLDSELDLAEQPCSLSFFMIPTSGSVDDLLAPLGLASGAAE
jgi:chemotaxis protein CheC